MECRTVLLADPCEEVTLELTRLLREEFRVISCRDGQEALLLAEQEDPALIILELSLPRMDGMQLLRTLGRWESRPLVLIYTAANTDYLLGALRELPVDYLLRKPMPVPTVAERAREMLEAQSQTEADWRTSDLLIRLGIPEHLQGFRNMVVGIPLLSEDPNQFLGKTLYMEIAHRNRVTFESVEKSIRDAIRSGWAKGNRALWLKYFPGATAAPHNKAFLIRMAAILRRHRRCG